MAWEKREEDVSVSRRGGDSFVRGGEGSWRRTPQGPELEQARPYKSREGVLVLIERRHGKKKRKRGGKKVHHSNMGPPDAIRVESNNVIRNQRLEGHQGKVLRKKRRGKHDALLRDEVDRELKSCTRRVGP